MAEITAEIRAYLLENSAISAAFGTRIYSVKAHDTQTYPFAIVRVVTDQPIYTQDGEALREAIIQVDVFDDDLAGCITNANLVRALLTGHSGTLDKVVVGAVFMRDERREWSPEARHFRAFQQYEVKWTV